MRGGNIFCLILCAVCICACTCGAGCLTAPDSQETVPPTPGSPESVISFQVAEANAEETLTRLIEEEIAGNPDLAGFQVDTFYNNTTLEVVDSRSYCHDDEASPIYVYIFRHTMPSLKDPQHMQDDVTVQITVVDGVVTEQVISIGVNGAVGSF